MTVLFPLEECEPSLGASVTVEHSQALPTSVTLYVCTSRGLAGDADWEKLVKKFKKEVNYIYVIMLQSQCG